LNRKNILFKVKETSYITKHKLEKIQYREMKVAPYRLCQKRHSQVNKNPHMI